MEPQIVYRLAKFADCLCPNLILNENDQAWYICIDNKPNRTHVANQQSWRIRKTKMANKYAKNGLPSKIWTLDRQVALEYLKINLREAIARIVDFSARADAIEDGDEDAMRRTGVFGKNS